MGPMPAFTYSNEVEAGPEEKSGNTVRASGGAYRRAPMQIMRPFVLAAVLAATASVGLPPLPTSGGTARKFRHCTVEPVAASAPLWRDDETSAPKDGFGWPSAAAGVASGGSASAS